MGKKLSKGSNPKKDNSNKTKISYTDKIKKEKKDSEYLLNIKKKIIENTSIKKRNELIDFLLSNVPKGYDSKGNNASISTKRSNPVLRSSISFNDKDPKISCNLIAISKNTIILLTKTIYNTIKGYAQNIENSQFKSKLTLLYIKDIIFMILLLKMMKIII
jgi:hypothetical protein